ncbi:hypothetical protein GCM10010145_44110 [Streptomyces ruber]|uniref:Uncharacterized protein n=2 Tax=Streptomyces TaxID=1883 RepID=A0A918ETJ9_9ACTN|nr:hypothetical protein GCM10010145_44110 [Streptomyces ruber]
MHSSSTPGPEDRPCPESPKPPKGTATWMVLYALIQKVPACTERATWWARETSPVHTAPARPKSVALARAIASASASKASAPAGVRRPARRG